MPGGAVEVVQADQDDQPRALGTLSPGRCLGARSHGGGFGKAALRRLQ